MDHEKCYVFSDERPAKRRRVEHREGLDASLPERQQLYNELWSEQRQRIDDVIKTANETTLDEISTFLSEQRQSDHSEGLAAGFLLAGPSIAAHALIFEQLHERSRDQPGSIFISVSSNDGLNLKTLLKAIIKIGTSQKGLDEDELDLLPSKPNGRRLLDYDLQLLHEWVKDNAIEQCVIVFRDCEAFDSTVLSEAIELLRIWSNRIPIVLLFGIATTVENLQDRLSQNAARCLSGQQFDVVQSDEILEEMFGTATIRGDHKVWLGAQLSNMLLQRHHENLLSSQEFVESVQYAYMSHFHANPLSVFLSEGLEAASISAEHFDALRNAPSFRRFAEDSVEDAGEARKLKSLFESNEDLFDAIKSAIADLQQTLFYAAQTVQVIHSIQKRLFKGATTASDLYTKALSGAFVDSPVIRELLLGVRKCPSNVLADTLGAITSVCPEACKSDLEDLSTRLNTLIREDDSGQPMRSEHDVHHDTMRTTVVAQKVQLSRHKAKLSEKDEAYSKLVMETHDFLDKMFKDLRNPMEMLGHEIVIYDQRTPHRAAMMPKPRFAIERALSSPHDYLNCQCCGTAGGKAGEEATISSSLPSTALLYRLYLESGSLINASDLWSAYAAIMGCDSDEDKAQAMPLFQRSLAELKYLGMVKSTRKKTDHVVKVAWKGL